ncbi:MAG: endonuclease VIII [Myxococcota bacterium]
MPEGPEIHRAADRVRRAVGGRVAEEVYFGQPHLHDHGPRLSGNEVIRVHARGKALLTSFASGDTVFCHSLLYGRWYVMRRGRKPRTGRSLRFAVHTETHSALLYSASAIDIVPTHAIESHPFIRRLGPDPLDEQCAPDDVLRRLEAHPRKRLGALLLDQGCVAGLGNYLRSEILFAAELHPDVRPGDCDGPTLRCLAHCIVSLTRQAYAMGGVTLDPELSAARKATGMRRRHYRHAVFTSAGRPCPRCGRRIERITSSGRRCYICPHCQPAPGASASPSAVVASPPR